MATRKLHKLHILLRIVGRSKGYCLIYSLIAITGLFPLATSLVKFMQHSFSQLLMNVIQGHECSMISMNFQPCSYKQISNARPCRSTSGAYIKNKLPGASLERETTRAVEVNIYRSKPTSEWNVVTGY